MSLVVANDVRERIRQAIDIVDLVSSSISLRRQGRIFTGLCPWHNDSKPSLQVNPDRQSWKCWVCDVGGDVFSFVMQREGVGFREAMQMLADRAGISLDSNPQPQAPPGSPGDKRTLLKATEWAETLFHECLLKSPEAEIARQYLTERQVTPESVTKFRIGFSPNNWSWLVDRGRAAKFSPQVLEACGLVGKSEKGQHYDRFKGRVMFPIRDVQNRPIAFGGRVLPQFAKLTAEEEQHGRRPPAKYVNSPETKLFSKSDQLYLLNVAREHVTIGPHATKSHEMIVVEGYTDAIIAHQFGFPNVVAVLGTALNERHIKLLKRFVESVTLLLDGDEAGQRRTNEILELFVATQMDLRILTLPDELDPAEFLLERGAAPFRELLKNTVDALEHKIRVTLQGIDVTRDTHRASRALEEVLSTIAKAPRSPLDTTQQHEQRKQMLYTRLAREFLLTEAELRTRVQELREKQEAKQVRFQAPAAKESSPGRTGTPARPTSAGPDHLDAYSTEPDVYPDEIDAVLRGDIGTTDRRPDAPAQRVDAEANWTDPSVRPTKPATKPTVKQLDARERELFEIFTQHPHLVSIAVRNIETEQLPSRLGKQLFTLYMRLQEEGESVEFIRVLSEFDDPQMKSVLVELDERAQDKAGSTQEKAEQRLTLLLRDFSHKRKEVERRGQLAALEKRNLNEKEALSILHELIADKRERQGITAPTDGQRALS